MKKNTVLALLALVATAAAPVAAQERQAEEPKKEKKVCRSQKMTGSLTRVTRICMTQAEWDQLADRTKRGLDEMGRAASGGQCVSSDPMMGGRC